MTNQQGDQDALNALVNDYGWEWKQGDVYSWMNSDTVFIAHDEIHANNLNTEDGWQQKIKVYAGTWVEGRLRELIGEAFRALKYNPFMNSGKGGYLCSFWPKSRDENPDQAFGDTPITALCAALRAVLKQKEAG